MKKILLMITVISGLSVFSLNIYAKGRQNNQEVVYAGPFVTQGGIVLALCSYRPSKNIAAQQKNGVFGKAYNDPQGDEGIQVAFSPFLALTPACEINLGFLEDFGDADPLPHED